MTVLWVFVLLTLNGQVVGARGSWEECEAARQAQIRVHEADQIAVLKASACRSIALEDHR